MLVVAIIAVMGLSRPFTNYMDSDKVDVSAIIAAVKAELPLGASSGVAVIDGCTDIGGVTTCQKKQALRTATSTVCSFKSPAATSTLVHAALRIAVGSSTATVWDLSKGTSAFATTSGAHLARYSLGSGAQGTMVYATSTNSVAGYVGTVDANMVFAPNTWAVWTGMAFAPNDATKFTGVCTATFEAI